MLQFIKQFLFGKEVRFYDPILGELKTRVKKANTTVSYTWTGEYILPGQKKKTFFIVEGNYLAPDKVQLNSLYYIIENLDEIIAKVDTELKAKPSVKSRFKQQWSDAFYLAAILPYAADGGNAFELSFEPLAEEDTDYVGLIWQNGILIDIIAN
ncbi:MAG: hypothetical protein ACK4TA_11050 [Saprospiraceae bacterium]